MNGIEMMLKSAGLDLEKAQKDFEELKTGVIRTLQEISTRLSALEEKQTEVIDLLKGPSLADSLELAGKLEELIQWKRTQEREQAARELSSLRRQPQPAKLPKQPPPV